MGLNSRVILSRGDELTEASLRIAEVTQASTAGFFAQCYELFDLPPLGSLVKCRDGENEIVAVTCNAVTSSLEPGRRPIARGKNEQVQEDVFRSNPQLAQLLKSEFEAAVLGHSANSIYYHYLPPRPVKLHSFVYLCEADEIVEFSRSLEFLSLLAGARTEMPSEELIAACIRYVGACHAEPSDFTTQAGKKLAQIFIDDYQKLRAILLRLKL